MQPTDQVAADLLAEDILESVAGDRLVASDGGQHSDIVFAQIKILRSQIRCRPDRRRVSNPGAQHPSGTWDRRPLPRVAQVAPVQPGREPLGLQIR